MKTKHAGMRASAALVLVLGCSIAHSSDAMQGNRWGFVKVGHDNIVVDPTVRRYTGAVAGLGSPDASGKLFTFKTVPLGPRSFPLTHDDLRGWRMTVLAGKRFGEVFTVSTNSASEITVTADKGPIDGLGEKDVFIIESVDANGVSMFGPAAGASAPASAGV